MLFLDMDDVCCNFVEAALRAHGKSADWVEDIMNRHNPDWLVEDMLGMTREDFWEPIDDLTNGFWTGLKPMPWLPQLMQLMNKFDWRLLTSPHSTTWCYQGKLHWVNFHLGTEIGNKMILCKEKWMLASDPACILIDDSPRQCNDWMEAGGTAILFPAFNNMLWDQTNPVNYLEEELKCLGLKV